VNDLTDQQLLRDYSGSRSEPAFAELVRRHVDLIYSAALRMLHDAHLAEDVTQNVFLALAQNAGRLTTHPGLSGWLHRTTINLAANALRSDTRRRAREQEAAAMHDLLSAEPDVAWEHIAPQLDAALNELSEADRDALFLRYFERKSAREMARALGVTDDAAQKRLNRAVDRLRESFSRRGVTVGAGGLVVVISARAVQAAPAGLALTISTTAALTGTTFAGAATAVAVKTIAMTTLQKTFVAAVLALTAGAGLYAIHRTSRLRGDLDTLQQQHASLAFEAQQLTRERDEATNRLATVLSDNERLKRDTAELLRLRGEAAALRQRQRELDQASVTTQFRGPGPAALPPSAETAAAANPPAFQLSLVLDEPSDGVEVMTNAAGGDRTYNVVRTPLLDKTALNSVNVTTNALGMSQIEIEFSAAGAEQFAQITREHLNKRLAILLDGKLYSAPLIRSEITNGKAQINGSFSVEEAGELAAKINAALASQ
jgi:RNA polymerase sigma factor (sigma-70 family)